MPIVVERKWPDAKFQAARAINVEMIDRKLSACQSSGRILVIAPQVDDDAKTNAGGAQRISDHAVILSAPYFSTSGLLKIT